MTDTKFPNPHDIIRRAADPNYRVPNYPTAADPVPPRPDYPVEPRTEDEQAGRVEPTNR